MDDMEVRRRRAIYRAQHRGTKELDIVMSRFAAARVAEMNADEMTLFEQFLVLPEPQLYDWVMRGEPVGDPGFAGLVADVRRLGGFDGGCKAGQQDLN
ncbi:MAG: succinate dehydrogenase assembly factor 2 [Alphaproteobacteria bacterium]|nr:succinate dehydrogenase assembly factor 2 [Alphaproteobacteria bacterium]